MPKKVSDDGTSADLTHEAARFCCRAPIGAPRRDWRQPRRRIDFVFHNLTTTFSVGTLKTMEVQLSPDQEAFVRQAIETGRFLREEDAVKEALSLWEERERTRAEILAAVDEAEASLARGEGRIVTQQSMRDLAEEVKQRGRARLAAEQSVPR